MTLGDAAHAVARVGERLREARLDARLTVREAAERAGLRAHGTLVQYENGKVLPPLDRLAALAQAYNISLASLLVTDDSLIPVVTMLERASAPQMRVLAQLLQHAALEGADEPPAP